MKKIIKKQLKKEKGKIMSDNSLPIELKNIWYSGFCLTDLHNFAEFDINKIPEMPEGVTLRKMELTKKDFSYSLGDKVKKVNFEKNNVSFDNIKKYININFFNYFKTKYKNEVIYWITNLNKREIDYGMIGFVTEQNELKGILKLK